MTPETSPASSPFVVLAMLTFEVSLSVMLRVPVASVMLSCPPKVFDKPDSVRVAVSEPSTSVSLVIGTVKVWVCGEAVGVPVKLSAVGPTAV